MANPQLASGSLTKKAMRAKPSQRKKAHRAADRKGSRAVKERSGGRCEARAELAGCYMVARCPRRATQVHHMVCGRGQRGIGLSARAEHKQHLCFECHLAITGGIGGRKLVRIGGTVPYWTDVYRQAE